MRRLGVRHVRTGLSWADSFRPNALAWFDRQMEALAEFDVTVTFCFTPEHRGIAPHHTSPPLDVNEFADFCARHDRALLRDHRHGTVRAGRDGGPYYARRDPGDGFGRHRRRAGCGALRR